MTEDRNRLCGAALLVAASAVLSGPSLAQGSVQDVIAKTSGVGKCYLEKTRKLSDTRPCQPAADVAENAIKACKSLEDDLLSARKDAEMDAGRSVIVALRDKARKGLQDTVFTVRISAAHCKNP